MPRQSGSDRPERALRTIAEEEGLEFPSLALEVRSDRGAWRETPGATDAADHVPGMSLISLTNDYLEGRPLARGALGDCRGQLAQDSND